MNKRFTQRWLILASTLIAASCGGGNSTNASPAPTPAPAGSPSAQAAEATAQHNPLCQAIQPFYWEVGDSTGVLDSASVGDNPPDADTQMSIASASKLPFAAYVVEKYDTPTNGANFTSYIPYLNFTSGYSNFDNSQCLLALTVASCNNGGINLQEAAGNIFHYEGGHMQQLASAPLGPGGLGLGDMTADQLTAEVATVLGLPQAQFFFATPQPAGGISTSARVYGAFLRRLLVDSPSPLKIASLLDQDARCTQFDPSACPNAAPPDQSDVDLIPDNFYYGLGHWIENDRNTAPPNNFAYSSAGAHGFYPWLSADRKLYGIVARDSVQGETNGTGAGYASLQCGRLIRQAWITGNMQTASNPQ